MIKRLFQLINFIAVFMFLIIGFEIKNESIIYDSFVETLEYNVVSIIKYSLKSNDQGIYFDEIIFEEKLIEKILLDLNKVNIKKYKLSIGYFQELYKGVGVCLIYKKTIMEKEIKVKYLIII